MENKKVRVRYAPSPTGMLHIGGARSALYNYLFAKKNGGEFIIRIEDTDIERNVEGGIESQIEGLRWLGIEADESPLLPNPKYAPYLQTQRLDLYRQWAEWLVEKGFAYYCYCTEDELENDREEQTRLGATAGQYSRRCLHASKETIDQFIKENRKPCIRLKLADHHVIKFHDIVRGDVEFSNDDIGDWVILKSNGIPTYNFGVVIDDHFMDITHVMRGEEHLSNTPKQIQLFEYFGWEIPTFGHMTLIVSENGKKLSKRDPHIIQFIQQYKELGYLPEALFNFILLLGWAPEGEREIFSRIEAIEAFSEKRLSKSPSMFDTAKLEWINNQYIKHLSDEKLLELCLPHLEKKYSLNDKSLEWKLLICKLFQPQLICGAQLAELAHVVFEKPRELEEEAKEVMKDPTISNTLRIFKEEIESVDELNQENVKVILKNTQTKAQVKGKMLYMPLRIALTSQVHGPDFVILVTLLGKKEVVSRL